MAKERSIFICQECGTQSPRWIGKCSGCNKWDTFVEEATASSVDSKAKEKAEKQVLDIQPLSETRNEAVAKERLLTGMGELDRVLGGGLVRDAFVLIGGDPGIGKSTLLLQITGLLAKRDLRVLYLSGEESAEQISNRAVRLGVEGTGIFVGAAHTTQVILASIEKYRPHVLVVDSLQTFVNSDFESAPGSVSQVREVASVLMRIAKQEAIAVWLVGHVTKDGSIAGPRTIEHMVDTVLYFESAGSEGYRLLRTVKNRFGSTRELGIFDMGQRGLTPVANPSALFLSERKVPVSGVAVGTTVEGSRTLLLEIQALLVSSNLATPRRTAVGLDHNRLAILAAVAEKHAGLELGRLDLFLNVAGGLRLEDTGADLAVLAAIWSSAMNRGIPERWCFIGEVGLTGEVRAPHLLESRIDEAVTLGFSTIVIAKQAVKNFSSKKNVTLKEIQSVRDIGGVIGSGL